MKRIIAVLLTLMMALSLTACSGDDNAKVAGTWKWNCDITEIFQEGVNQGAGMDLSTDATMEMVFVLKLNEDGTYTLNVDRDALKTSLQTYIDSLIPAGISFADRRAFIGCSIIHQNDFHIGKALIYNAFYTLIQIRRGIINRYDHTDCSL